MSASQDGPDRRSPGTDTTPSGPGLSAPGTPRPQWSAPADATRIVPPGENFEFDDDDVTRVRPSTRSSVPGPVASAPATSPTGSLPGRTYTGLPEQLPPDLAATAADTPIRQVGRYLIQSRLGRGGMATVYRAHDPQIGRDVAIKFLHASLAENEECHVRFVDEARSAGRLAHPNIVVIHDVGEIEGRPYMAMELLDGISLAELLGKDPVRPIREVIVLGIQLARALDYAHGRGIFHRDIKPGNIMVLADGKTVKVTDFGIAHIDDSDRQRTQVGAVIGTPQYMSPEQTRGDKIDGRSDLFSAGIVLYQMLAGERPFGGDNLVAVAGHIANDPPPPLGTARPDAPPALRRIVERCLAKAPAQRFQTGQDLAEALVRVLNAWDEAALEKARPRIVPLRIKWALAMAAVVALVMGITATIVTQRQYGALMAQATDYGASLARFIARQNAQSALAEEWEVADVTVQEMMKTGNFERIVVIDSGGLVRAASVPDLVGQPYKPAGTESLGRLAGGTTVLRYNVGQESVLGFEAPMQFQDTPVGRVALGIREAPLTQVARLSIALMLTLVLITVLAVAVAMYFLGDWFSRPVKLVADALREVAQGNLNHRIAETRKDEFGQLFAQFDAMADAMQARAALAEEPGGPAAAFGPEHRPAPRTAEPTAPPTSL